LTARIGACFPELKQFAPWVAPGLFLKNQPLNSRNTTMLFIAMLALGFFIAEGWALVRWHHFG
jgi:hypothetical protein